MLEEERVAARERECEPKRKKKKEETHGWWTVTRIACPAEASLRRKRTMLKADWPSSPEVGSSRKSSSWGLEASSTPMVTLLRASTPTQLRQLSDEGGETETEQRTETKSRNSDD